MWVYSRAMLDGIATQLSDDTIPTSTTLKNSWLGLLRGTVDYTPDSDDSIVTTNEANYEGYMRQQLTSWGAVFVGEGLLSLRAAPALQFQPTGDDTVNTIFGQFIMGSDSSTLLAVELFDEPIPLPNSLSALVTVVITGLGQPDTGFGSSIVSAG